jgi:hypothetical protein
VLHLDLTRRHERFAPRCEMPNQPSTGSRPSSPRRLGFSIDTGSGKHKLAPSRSDLPRSFPSHTCMSAQKGDYNDEDT